ncbi:MAG: hypothetical protein ACOY93_14305 [Bacillota bacterium]
MTMRLLRTGSLAGLGLVLLLALVDRAVYRNPFGLFTGIVGALAGGMLLLLGFVMALTSYLLASRGQAVALRRRLLAAATFTGAAGLVGGTTAILVWLAAGRPLFP